MLFLVLITVASVLCGIPGTNVEEGTKSIQKQLENEAQSYLKAFGYLPLTKSGDFEFKKALKTFQESYLIYPSGIVDIPTLSKMNELRCANPDVYNGGQVPAAKDLWKKKTITWAVTSSPDGITIEEVREAAKAAFNTWKTAVEFDFSMVLNQANADITITFDSAPNTFLKVAASATKPIRSKIILDKNQPWAYYQEQPSALSIYHALLHEIGHCLGLPHNFYRGSAMFPIMKSGRRPKAILSSVASIDRIAVRRLYGLTEMDNNLIPDDNSFQKVTCPKFIDSVVAVSNEQWMLFRKNKVWRVSEKKYSDVGRQIAQVFPEGPQFVNATVFSNGLVLLFVDRTIYGYEFDGITFTRANGYPKELHDRVLFYPQGAFPLNNGSVILLSGNVFATYNVARNQPSFLNDKNRYFPNLPEDLRSGVQKEFGSDESYWMFDEATVSGYDMPSKQITALKSIPEFIKC